MESLALSRECDEIYCLTAPKIPPKRYKPIEGHPFPPAGCVWYAVSEPELLNF